MGKRERCLVTGVVMVVVFMFEHWHALAKHIS